jgi:alkylhydroperoxidase family enzyme
MPFIATRPGADGAAPNHELAFSQRPEVYAAWQQLIGSIRSGMDLRRYELVTLAAARRLKSSYCVLAHGSVLMENDLLDAGALTALVTDPPGAAPAALSEVDRAVIALAEQVVDDATAVSQATIDHLRSLGLTDADVFDVIATATARCFFSKTLDAVGAQADAKFQSLDPALRDALTVGRPIADAE